jgi:hypothetical protein
VCNNNNYSTLSEEKHKKISNNLSNAKTNRNALVPVVSNLPRTTSTNYTASSTAYVSCRIIPMFLLTVPIQICQVKLVLCFTGGPPCQHTELVNVHTNDNWAFECLTALVNTFLWIISVCWNKRFIFLFSLLCLFCSKNARIVYVYMLPSHVCNMCTFMSVVHTSWRMRYKLMCFHIYEKTY